VLLLLLLLLHHHLVSHHLHHLHLLGRHLSLALYLSVHTLHALHSLLMLLLLLLSKHGTLLGLHLLEGLRILHHLLLHLGVVHHHILTHLRVLCHHVGRRAGLSHARSSLDVRAIDRRAVGHVWRSMWHTRRVGRMTLLASPGRHVMTHRNGHGCILNDGCWS